jgi:hypothetical protein
MAKFLNTRGRARLAISFCDRCQRKFPIDDLQPDGDKPSLNVCDGCWDSIDPYRLPQRQPDDFSLPDAGTNDLTPEES